MQYYHTIFFVIGLLLVSCANSNLKHGQVSHPDRMTASMGNNEANDKTDRPLNIELINYTPDELIGLYTFKSEPIDAQNVCSKIEGRTLKFLTEYRYYCEFKKTIFSEAKQIPEHFSCTTIEDRLFADYFKPFAVEQLVFFD